MGELDRDLLGSEVRAVSARLDGRVALVTGGGQGLGLAIARDLASEGARVMLVGRDTTTLADAAASFPYPNPVATHACDVRVATEVQAATAATVDRFGRLDVLVNNAGTSTIGDVIDLPEEEWDLVFDVNMKGTFLFSKAAARVMLDHGSGTIVNIASREAKRPTPGFSHYGASKAAMLSFTRSLALELAPTIRVNAVCPGLVRTRLLEQHLHAEQLDRQVPLEVLLAERTADIPLGRMQDARSIARAVRFLVSDDAADITGQALTVDGGSVMA